MGTPEDVAAEKYFTPPEEDKEAQELLTLLHICNEGSTDKQDELLCKKILEAGYRKLPQKKPPLLSKGEVKLWKANKLSIPLELTPLCDADNREAQREADIKHYEGK